MLHALADLLLAITKSRVETMCQVMPELVYTLGVYKHLPLSTQAGEIDKMWTFQQH